MSGTLFIVATPIGNLEDLTPRARQTLASVGLVAAEDTRHTGRLLMHIGAKPRQIALHDHNESKAVESLIKALESGEDVALVSDAGTPLVSDPGYRLVRAAHDHSINVVPVVGPSAVTAALSAAGLPTDRFSFEGFLPAKQAARRTALAELAAERRTMVMFESVHRIEESIADMIEAFGPDRDAFIGRELSKLHEQCVNGTLGELLAQLQDGGITRKGEFVVVVAGDRRDAPQSVDVERLLGALADVLSAKDAARVAADVTGQRKNDLYARLLELKR